MICNRRLSAEFYLWMLGIGIALAIASLWMPWLHSGSSTRHAFELLDTAQELELGPTLLRSSWSWLLPMAPLLGAIGFLSALLGKKLLCLTAILSFTAIVAGGVAVGIIEQLNRGYGSHVAGIACGLILLSATRPALFENA